MYCYFFGALKDGNEVTHFLVSKDLDFVQVMTKDEFAKYCAQDIVSEMYYDCSKFIPIEPRDDLDAMMQVKWNKKRTPLNVSFRDFINYNNFLRLEDYKRMQSKYGNDFMVIFPAAIVRTTDYSYRLTATIWSPDLGVTDVVRNDWIACNGDYTDTIANLCSCNIPIVDIDSSVMKLSKICRREGAKGVLWATNMLDTNADRVIWHFENSENKDFLKTRNVVPNPMAISLFKKSCEGVNEVLA